MTNVRIAVNASVTTGRLTGVGYCALSLIRAITQIRTRVEWLICGIPQGLLSIEHLPNVEIVNVEGRGFLSRISWEQLILPRLLRDRKVDVLHCPDFSRPISCAPPVVNTIHDLSFELKEGFFSPGKKMYKQAMTRITMRNGRSLVADSEFTRQEIQRLYDIPANDIQVIHLGVDAPSFDSQNVFGDTIDEPFILFVGTLESRKNLVRLVKAFSDLKRSHHIPHKLILAGQWGRGAEAIKSEIASSGAARDIQARGYLDRSEILRLYKEAHLVVYPSLYEGFGLPILEAMSYGKAVVCSNSSSLPEVAGDAAEYCDPYDHHDIARAMYKVLGSEQLRNQLAQRGLSRVRSFTWHKCAEKYLDLFSRIAGEELKVN